MCLLLYITCGHDNQREQQDCNASAVLAQQQPPDVLHAGHPQDVSHAVPHGHLPRGVCSRNTNSANTLQLKPETTSFLFLMWAKLFSSLSDTLQDKSTWNFKAGRSLRILQCHFLSLFITVSSHYLKYSVMSKNTFRNGLTSN